MSESSWKIVIVAFISLGIVQCVGVDHARSSHGDWDATASSWFPPWGVYRGIESFFHKDEPRNVAEAIERIDYDDDPALGSSAEEVAQLETVLEGTGVEFNHDTRQFEWPPFTEYEKSVFDRTYYDAERRELTQEEVVRFREVVKQYHERVRVPYSEELAKALFLAVDLQLAVRREGCECILKSIERGRPFTSRAMVRIRTSLSSISRRSRTKRRIAIVPGRVG